MERVRKRRRRWRIEFVKIGITCYPTYGGSGIVATELGMELAARGHDVHFISYANPIRLDTAIPRIHYHEVEVSNYPLFHYPPYCLALASRMAEVAAVYGLDLLHVHYAIPHSIAALLAKQMTANRRLPFVTTLHGTDITLVGMDRSYFPITKFSIEQSDGITTISEYLRKKTTDFFGISKDVEVIHNFVNCDLYQPAEPRPKRATLLHISNFRPVKRVADCIRILKEVRKHVDARLLMAGDGPDRGPAESLACDLGLAGHVEFLGKRDHIERLIPTADVLLLPSEMEAFGLAALEAMACAVPPVATRTGGVSELITHGVDGYVEPVGDITAQSARAIELLTDDRLYARIATAARKTAETRYCTSKIIPLYERMYTRVIG
ncbi:MAG TPA: N-acetyl-alpha-D-glucosaminyl L-malate synthase BshA [Bryobacteraceae bacterium]|jgi:N-acetyl-alpha-D-glucosaminyl L-malate synthase BshA|nr:N-acetyl-alpha-D-glucosaminyl L-malate synthase BshA [Bryobacteraceae bacterium]